jgi:hypothetical protein
MSKTIMNSCTYADPAPLMLFTDYTIYAQAHIMRKRILCACAYGIIAIFFGCPVRGEKKGNKIMYNNRLRLLYHKEETESAGYLNAPGCLGGGFRDAYC